MDSLKSQAIDIIKQKGLKKLSEPIQLASGAMSQDFVDGKLATSHFDDLEIASRAIVDGILLQGLDFDVVGGPTLGADALTIGIAGIQRCRWFFVRKKPKGRGTNKLIEGSPIGDGDRCLIIEDAITTGGSLLKAVDAVEATGAKVVAVATLVDRGEIARPLIEARGIFYYPIATYLDLGIEPVGLPD
ncbi:MAG: orotate phosphoribosyltransferase [Acidimicrobiaceae bacterium]|jgi:orotate phosphoribosyltransferase|nr:orotate phosphoribosyltransferase [Acidimicrobiaceae bacterium]|tara:strand:- start:33651 stop:34214 length:564 start_codon:yes stop_codon:yes gene_type:complete